MFVIRINSTLKGDCRKSFLKAGTQSHPIVSPPYAKFETLQKATHFAAASGWREMGWILTIEEENYD